MALIAVVYRIGVPIQSAIRGISAASLLAIAIVVLLWTRAPLLSALLLAAPAAVGLARTGTPDALSTAFVLGALWAYASEKIAPAVILLLLSIWIRTDNVIITILLIGAILIRGNIRLPAAIAAAAVAVASVLIINRFAGNYGWAVLFQTSFVGDRAGEIAPHITIAQYLRVFAMGVQGIFSQAALWILLALAAWKRNCHRNLLALVGLAAFAHFVLFPSGEARYLVWCFLTGGVLFVVSLKSTAANVLRERNSFRSATAG